MEMIAKDEAIAMLEDMEGRRYDEDGYVKVNKLDVIANLRSLPSIDLVRCEECKHHEEDRWGYGDCERPFFVGHLRTAPYDFCSSGERRTDERAI